MAAFHISFLKTIANDTGHETEICQRVVEVRTDDPNQALAHGLQLFCRLEHIQDWTLKADRFEVKPVPRQRQGAVPQAEPAGGRHAEPYWCRLPRTRKATEKVRKRG